MNERDFVEDAFNHISLVMEARCCVPASDCAAALAASGNPFDNLLALLARHGEDCGITDRDLVEMYRSHRPLSLPYRGDAERTLQGLKDRGVSLALITDGRCGTQFAKINALGLDKYISPENVIISGATGHDKQDSYNFELLMSRHPMADTYMYVGDNVVKDFYWPRSLGWVTFALIDSSGVNIHRQRFEDAEEPFQPNFKIERLSQLFDFIY